MEKPCVLSMKGIRDWSWNGPASQSLLERSYTEYLPVQCPARPKTFYQYLSHARSRSRILKPVCTSSTCSWSTFLPLMAQLKSWRRTQSKKFLNLRSPASGRRRCWFKDSFLPFAPQRSLWNFASIWSSQRKWPNSHWGQSLICLGMRVLERAKLAARLRGGKTQ